MELTLVESTPPPSSSLTPPPSTQLPSKATENHFSTVRPDGAAIIARTPTPTMSLLSSPPPTVQTSSRPTLPSLVSAVPSPSEISKASPVEIIERFQTSATEISRLSAQLQDARTSAAHFKLQHNLLSIEATEVVNRLEVEHEMTRREVEVLGDLRDEKHVHHQKEGGESREIFNAELQNYTQHVQMENEMLKKRLARAKKLIMKRDNQIESLTEANDQLKNRIRENREHLNRLRGPGGLYQFATPKQPSTNPNTPRRSAAKSHKVSQSAQQPRTQHRGDDSTFAALLLADQVLSQGNASAPSTPLRNRPAKAATSGHSRGTHSLSSLPVTPRQSRPATAGSGGLLPPINVGSAPMPQIPPLDSQRNDRRRRESRDSTISASESEENGRAYNDTDSDLEVPESQASQLATSMLRHSQSVKSSPSSSQAMKSSGLLQAKLLGSVKKHNPNSSIDDNGSKKRAREATEEYLRDGKRLKAGEGVGLGIGWDGVQS